MTNEPIAATRALPARWTALASLAFWALGVYLAIVLPLDSILPAIANRWYVAGLLFVASFAPIYRGVRYFALRADNAEERLKGATLLAVTVLFCFLGMDIAYTAYSNSNPTLRADLRGRAFQDQRSEDPQVWTGELRPVTYQPTDRNFSLYKPGQTRTAIVFGEHYYPALARHPVIRDYVLEPRKVEYSIDQFGLRNVDDPATAQIFALGDSYCFGDRMTQRATFPELLKARLGEPVYNMGVTGASPQQELLLFEYLLQTHPEAFKPKHLLWLIFEGNDLDDYYEKQAPTSGASRGLRDIFAGTIVGGAADLPALLRQQSVIRLLTTGRISLTSAGSRQKEAKHFKLDGEWLTNPLYHSARFGYAIFYESYLRQAGQSEPDVLNHPNWPRLIDTFRRMHTLAGKHRFDVTVVTVPSNVRLYKDYFEDLPPVADQPYFIKQVKKLAAELGFSRVDLTELLAPYAAKELIYFRDDTHWNERGHELVAELLSQHSFGAAR